MADKSSTTPRRSGGRVCCFAPYLDNLANADAVGPGMERILAETEEKDTNCIVVVDLSCIAPDIHKAGKHLEEMKAAGIRIVFH